MRGRHCGGLDYQEDLGVGGEESLVELGVNDPRVEEDLEAVLGRVDSEIRGLVGGLALLGEHVGDTGGKTGRARYEYL